MSPDRSVPSRLGWLLIATGVIATAFVLVLPLVVVVHGAFSSGLAVLWSNLTARESAQALGLSLLVAGVSLPVSFAIGLSGAWLIAYHRFPGRNLLLAISKIPISLSPIVAGVSYMMVYGRRGWLGPWLIAHDVELMFAVPGIILVTIFVSFPYLLNQLVPLMMDLGRDEEIVADQLGARGWTVFWRVTWPKIRWGVLYGLLLANARALGEFGAVSVVSGYIRGRTTTLPLQVQLLYDDYHTAGAFAAALVLMTTALVTLLLKLAFERRHRDPDGISP